jgi:hypothetical protein
LFLAYLGASLPLIVLFAVSRQPTSLIVNGELVAIEIVRTLVGSLGIVAAVPFTTLIAVWLTSNERATVSGRAREGRSLTDALRRPVVALAGGLAAIGVVTAVAAIAMAPLIASPPRAAVVPDRFDPSMPVPSASPDAAPSADSPSVPRGDPPIVQIGASVPVVEGSTVLGYVSLVQHRTEEVGGSRRLLTEFRYVAVTSFEVRPDAWVATPLAGDPAFGQPSGTSPALEAQTLDPGGSATGWLEFELAGDPSDVFLDYLDASGQVLFIVALL